MISPDFTKFLTISGEGGEGETDGVNEREEREEGNGGGERSTIKFYSRQNKLEVNVTHRIHLPEEKIQKGRLSNTVWTYHRNCKISRTGNEE